MSIVFHKDIHCNENVYNKKIIELIQSKGKNFFFSYEKNLDRKLRKAYPRGGAFIRMEMLELLSQWKKLTVSQPQHTKS
ncbi:hypothetical protein ABN349_02850 [Providencia rettgeri]|uniref:hypothetical protein n=1 Tax=Providencia rettgeri TaxID=587 RepID=UPI0032DA4123